MKKFLLSFYLLFACFVQAQINGDYRSAGTVSLTSLTNWETYNGTAWAAATVVPNTATFSSGNSITVLAAHTWNNNSNAIVPEGVTLLFQGFGGTFTANTLTINGTYIHASATTPSNVFNAISATTGLGPNSTVVYRASASYATPSASFGGRTYNNLTFDTDGTTTTQPSFSTPGFTSPLTINGTFTVDTWRADFFTSGNTTAVNLNGDVVITGTNGYLRLRSTTIAAGKTLTINATDSLGIGQAYTLTIAGSLVNKSTKPIAFSTSATMVMNGTYQHDVNGGTIPNTTATYNSGSTILITGVTSGANSAIPVLPTTCGNVTWNCTAQTASNTFVNTTSNSTTINGNLTIQSTGTANIYLGGAATGRTLTVNGNLIINGGKFGVMKPATGATGNQTCTVNGDVIISSGECYIADALAGATGYTGKGYLNITGSLNHTGGIIGSGATTIAGTGVLSFTTNNTDKTIATTGIAGGITVVVDKTATGLITLNTSTVLPSNATITLTTGKLAIAANATLELSSITGATATSYVVTLSSGANTGALKMSGITATTVFPVGSLNNYLPASITPSSSSDYTVGVFEGATSNGLPNGTAVTATKKQTMVDAIWQINRTSSSTDNATVLLNWPTALEGSGFAALANNIGVARCNIGIWSNFAGTGDNTANLANNSYNGFGSFAVGQIGTTLPVRFVAINAVAVNNNITVTWKVENEINLNKYIVEKSNDGASFNELQILTAKGSNTYSSIDKNPFAGNNYYRIKAIDKSGEARYSSVVRVNSTVKGKNELLVYPNPVINKTINLQLKELDTDNYSLLLVNSAGQVVYTKALGNINGSQSIVLPLQQSMVVGTYQLILKGEKQQLKQTVLIK